MEVTFEAICKLQFGSTHYIHCWNKIHFKYKKTKTYNIFDLKKVIGKNYENKSKHSPQINFQIYIGIPKIAGVNLKFNIKF